MNGHKGLAHLSFSFPAVAALISLLAPTALSAPLSSPLSNWTAWGAGGPGLSGDPHYGQSVIPSLQDNVVAVATGGGHNVALRADGTVYAWGRNDHGQSDAPLNLSNVKQVAAGHLYSMALTDTGSIIHWGAGIYGMRPIPAAVTNIVSIAAGASHCVALRRDGKVFAWGFEAWGATNVPSTLNNVVAIAAGDTMSAALKSDGSVVTWGYHDTVAPANLTDAVQLACGSAHVLALHRDGTVTAWGSESSSAAIQVPPGLRDVIQVAAGIDFSVALQADGSVVAWGTNNLGQTAVPPGLKARRISAGYFHVVAEQGDPAPLLQADTDGDSLSDWGELVRLGTDPANADTDGDHYGDAEEVALGTSPLDNASVPSQPLFPVGSLRLAPFGFRFNVLTPAQGEILVIEKSTNLTDWKRLIILPNPARLIEVADPGATESKETFYRAIRR